MNFVTDSKKQALEEARRLKSRYIKTKKYKFRVRRTYCPGAMVKPALPNLARVATMLGISCRGL